MSKDGNASDLVSKDEFGDFELELDWRIGEAGNSGIFYRGSEDEEAIYWTGPEYQLLDDIKARDNKTRNHCAGSVYDLYDAPEGHLKPVGEWNTTRIVARGAHVEHWLNGFKMVEYQLWSPDWEKHLAASKFKDWKNYGRIKKGHFGIQGNHPGRARRCATSASGSCSEHGQDAPLGDDVPPVLHLGIVVRHDGDLPRQDARVLGRIHRPGLRRDRDCRARLAVLPRHHRRPVLLVGEAAGDPARGRRRADVPGLAADRVELVLSAADPLRALLHADAVADQLGGVPPRRERGQGLPGDPRARHDRLDRRRDHRRQGAEGRRAGDADAARRRRLGA